MRIEYWGRIRLKSGSYYLTVPRDMAKSAARQMDESVTGNLIGKEVRVVVTL